jgi:antitoxin MazE
MKTDLIRIGNSRGVRIPKPLIEQCGFGETVELSVTKDCLIISPGRKPRRGWDDAFRTAGKAADDELMLEVKEPNEFDCKEWQW